MSWRQSRSVCNKVVHLSNRHPPGGPGHREGVAAPRGAAGFGCVHNTAVQIQNEGAPWGAPSFFLVFLTYPLIAPQYTQSMAAVIERCGGPT
jgi:hypothetical protein